MNVDRLKAWWPVLIKVALWGGALVLAILAARAGVDLDVVTQLVQEINQ